MHILVIGSGGREHALAWKLSQSPHVTHLFIAPGNGGTALETGMTQVDIAATDIKALIQFAKTQAIDLTIVGPELPLAMGIVDQFQQQQLKCFGPSKQAAQLESSKAFCKQFMQQHKIPTANYASFTEVAAAHSYLEQCTFPTVIKADGLAAGKGVVISHDISSAKKTVTDMLRHNQLGDAGAQIIIEDFLEGTELSYIAMVDGQNILPLASSQDHKKLRNHNLGPNTGGMGAFSPSPLITPQLEHEIMTRVMRPTVDALADMGTPYVGFLYAGLMISPGQTINVLEFNCRLGDPETQPIMMRLQSDLVELCLSALAGKLDQSEVQWDPRCALTIVMCSHGYPNKYQTGHTISGLEHAAEANSKVFHAGTTLDAPNVLTTGGRVLGVTALGDTLDVARDHCYSRVEQIHWQDCFYRTDIGKTVKLNCV